MLRKVAFGTSSNSSWKDNVSSRKKEAGFNLLLSILERKVSQN